MQRPFDFRSLVPRNQEPAALAASRIEVVEINGELKLTNIPTGLNGSIEMLKRMGQAPGQHLMLYRAFGRALRDGPKVFRPTYSQCIALEQVSLDLTLADYQQPFEVMLIEFPQQYADQRGAPRVSMVHRDSRYVLIYTQTASRSALGFTSSATQPLEAIFSEEAITPDTVSFEGDRLIQRVALNACLILARFPHQLTDLLSRTALRQTQERRRNRGVRTPLRMPQEITLVQHIDFHVEDRAQSDASHGGEGRSPQTHWRKGHWRSQAHGPGWSERRLIFVKPVLVNARADHAVPSERQVLYRGR